MGGSAVQRGRGPLDHHAVLRRGHDGRSICKDTGCSSDRTPRLRASSLGGRGERAGHLTAQPRFLSPWQNECKRKRSETFGELRASPSASRGGRQAGLPPTHPLTPVMPRPQNTPEGNGKQDHRQVSTRLYALRKNLDSYLRGSTFW